MSPSRKYHQLDLGAHLENSGALGNASSTLHTHRPLGRGISSSHPYPAGSASHPSQHRLRAPSCCQAQCLHRGNLQPCMGSHMPRPWQTPERGYLQTLMWDMAKAEQGPGTAGNSKAGRLQGNRASFVVWTALRERFQLLNLPCPMWRLHSGAVGLHVGHPCWEGTGMGMQMGATVLWEAPRILEPQNYFQQPCTQGSPLSHSNGFRVAKHTSSGRCRVGSGSPSPPSSPSAARAAPHSQDGTHCNSCGQGLGILWGWSQGILAMPP